MAGELQKAVPLIAASVGATTTSQRIPLKGVRKATVFITTDNSWAFSVKASPDNGTTEVVYNKMITNVTNTNGQTITRVATTTINNTSECFTLDLLQDAIESITVTGTRTGGNWTVGYIVLEYF